MGLPGFWKGYCTGIDEISTSYVLLFVGDMQKSGGIAVATPPDSFSVQCLFSIFAPGL
jgi:hypothetical protein